MPRRSFWLLLSVAVPLALLGFFAWPRPVEAQCGSSASSCKNCHEVQRKAPVNQNGAWHTGHAFGDFCEFCHGGNVKAKDQAAAHTGMTLQVVDVKASCQSCHPDDSAARAEKYAAILGRPLGNGGSAPTGAAAQPVALTNPGAAGSEPCGPAAPQGGETIDLAKIYADSKAPPAGNVGNGILLGLIGATFLTLGGLAWHYERPLPRFAGAFRQLLATPAAAPAGADDSLAAVFAGQPELANLVNLLRTSDQETLRALTHLLSDAQNGPKVIKAISSLDVDTLAKMSEGDRRALAALLNLVDELKA
jgi:hypothetical protein